MSHPNINVDPKFIDNYNEQLKKSIKSYMYNYNYSLDLPKSKVHVHHSLFGYQF